MRLILITLISALIGCGSGVEMRHAAGPTTGTLTDAKGKPVSNVLLTLQPLDNGHLAPLEVAADGSFKGEVFPGKYAYFVGKSSSKNSEKALKQIDAKYYEADLGRTVVVKPGEALSIVLQ
jgi:hypothetical protein